MRKHILWQAILLLGFFLCACDENNIVSTGEQARDASAENDTSVLDNGVIDTVKSIYSLGSCTEKREGKVSFVTKDEVYYLCVNQVWVTTTLEELESSSSAASSSSGKRSSADDGFDDGDLDEGDGEEPESKTEPDSSKVESSAAAVSSSAAKDTLSSSASVSSSSAGSVPESSSAVVSSSSAKVQSSSSVVVLSSSSAKVQSSSSAVELSSSSAKSSSSVSNVNVPTKYNCSIYNCVSTENLNQEMLAAGEYGEFLDTRDDQVYRTVTIGSQTWMAQNLNYASDNSSCANGVSANCSVYGRIYKSSAALTACPAGTHLSTISDWKTLYDYVYSNQHLSKNTVGYYLKSALLWTSVGSDKYGFAALPAGYLWVDGSYQEFGKGAYFWRTETGVSLENIPEYFTSTGEMTTDDVRSTLDGFAIRCLVGETSVKYSSSTTQSSSSVAVAVSSSSVSAINTKYDCSVYNCVTTKYLNQEMLAAGKYGELLDTSDNQVYRTVTIGEQTWMAQNLNYSKTGTTYCYDDVADYCLKYGRLYIRAAVHCPTGWHLPNDAEWEELFSYVGGKSVASAKLRASTGWDKHTDLNDADEFGFSSLPGGVYYFGDEGGTGWYLSDTGYNDYAINSGDAIAKSTAASYTAISVRCVKD